MGGVEWAWEDLRHQPSPHGVPSRLQGRDPLRLCADRTRRRSADLLDDHRRALAQGCLRRWAKSRSGLRGPSGGSLYAAAISYCRVTCVSLAHAHSVGKVSMSASLIAVSGLGPKEPAAFVVEADGVRLLLDCGEGPEPGRLPDFSAIGKVDAIILSHSHKDHAGALRFRDHVGSPPIYATAPVLTRIEKDIPAHPIPIRGRTEVLGIELATGANGHAPGGVWLRLAVGEGLLYMGDHSPE